MELGEFEKPYFSKWVEKEEKIYRNTSKNFNEDEIKNSIEQFSTHQNLNAKLKLIVRHAMHPKFRAHLWMVGSGGSSRYRDNSQCYHEDIKNLGIQIPSRLPTNVFNRKQSETLFYLLGPDGVRECLDVLYVISQTHADIQFCPLLPSITALFLHFMDKEQAYCCISEMLNSKKSYFDIGQASIAVSAKTFQDCLKTFMKKSYKHFKVITAASKDTTDSSKVAVFFPLWVSLVFSHLDFWTLVYIVDNFILQGPKVLVRVGLVLFNHFDKWLVKNEVVTLKDFDEKFAQFISELPLKGYKLMEAAFKIRGLSRKKLASLKAQNVVLLREGVLDVPFFLDNVKIPTLYRIQGTDILNDEQWEVLSSWLPEKLQIKQSYCLFSTQNDGFSIKTLYNKCEKQAESILLVKTSTGEIVGSFCTAPWEERQEGPKTLSYFGTGETFVFSLYEKKQKYSWDGNEDTSEGKNDFFMAGDKTCLMVGGGGDNALWLDGELLHGHSGTSRTFKNEPLTSKKDFEIVRVEVVGFQDC